MKKANKSVLVYANYYYPEVAAIAQLYTELLTGLSSSFDIKVICSVPCYTGMIEDRYLLHKYYHEHYKGVQIIRVRVPRFDKSSKISRVKHIVVYFFRSLLATRKAGRADVIIATSQPPILGGLLGVWGKWVKRAKFIYNIQDFNPEQTMAVGYSKNKLLLRILMALDKFSCRQADKVIVVGRDMVDTLKNRFQNRNVPPYAIINNWADEQKIIPLPMNDLKVADFRKKYVLENKFVFMYSGNIGLYYDLENLLKVMEQYPKGTRTSDGREVAFAFIGAGTMLDTLRKYKEQHQMDNVFFIPYQESEDLVYSLNAGDVHWCVNAKGIKGVSVPSKCYGIMAVGKPVLGVLDVGSEARLLVEETQSGLISEPEDYETTKRNICWFINNAGSEDVELMGHHGREYLLVNLSKDTSIRKYREAILRS